MAQQRVLTLESIVILNEDVVSREMDGKEIILNLETGYLFGLNQVATQIWTLLQKRCSLTEILLSLRKRYQIPGPIIERDILLLIEKMITKGIVRIL